MAVLDVLKKKLAGRDDATVEAELAELREREARFRRDHAHTRDDAHEFVTEWVSRAQAGPVNAAAFAGRSRDTHRDAVLEVVLAWAVAQPSFAAFLHERIDSLGGSDGVSNLTRAERDAELVKLRAGIHELQVE